ncbi:hypothetical protein MTR_2g049680 [Medicago truncatula]|uniref:Uncharacterized protein n=1 Tax=Medicago truncatula TaxID=3880 RepID=G7IIX2_MEDTR|nr:hypothetical protein MTR_2g049680 [Medicago truncatula]
MSLLFCASFPLFHGTEPKVKDDTNTVCQIGTISNFRDENSNDLYLQGRKTYLSLKKTKLITTSRKLCLFFVAHRILVRTEKPLKKVLFRLDLVRKMRKSGQSNSLNSIWGMSHGRP